MATPQIYKATYSSVPVYEMPCQGVAVMRRKADGWLNATQILKVAGFDKPQRTRVLEREVQKGTHEKVQGGYGKYQGTWVPMDRGIALSRQYGVDKLLQPIFDYLPTADSPPLAPKHITAIPSRPKKKLDGDPDNEGAGGSAAKPKPAARANAAKATAARKAAEAKRLLAERAREESEDEMMMMNGGGVGSDGRSLSPTPSEESDSSETPSPLGSDVEYQDGGGGGGGSRKRKIQELGGQQQHQQHHLQQHQQQQMQQQASAHAQLGLGPLRYARMILDYFVSESTQVPQFLVSPPADFDANVVIDDDGHTALHWACAMGRIRIVKLLLTAGADIFRANSMGQTALMRSVMFTNNYDLRKFPELFELLHRSTINIDRNDRTVFHYIVDIALQKGKTHAARYYIETVLARLVDYPKEVADILNFQDEEGETALTLAARARSKRLVKILLDHGADPKIPNRDNKTAEDYILEDERFRESDLGPGLGGDPANGAFASSSASHPLPSGAPGAASSSRGLLPSLAPFPARLHSSEVGQRASTQCIPAMADLLETLAQTFDRELADTERDLVQAHALLGNIDAELGESRRAVAALQESARGLDELAAKERALAAQLEHKMGKRFRLGWEKWVRDEDARERAYEDAGGAGGEPDLDALKELSVHPPADAVARAAAVRARVEAIKGDRRDLFAKFARLQSEAGTGTKMGQYKQLIALGCGVPLDQVDAVIESLCDTEESF